MRVLPYTSICLFGTRLAIPVHSQGSQALSERQTVPRPPGVNEPVADQPKPKTLSDTLDSLFGERNSPPGAGLLGEAGATIQDATGGLFGAGDAVLNGPIDAISGLLGGGSVDQLAKGESQPKKARQLLGGAVADLGNAAADVIEGP
ncbi:hypothetical protein N7488_003446 [Penicillium malachiteum]|nr:hypothetical protein N7488_003446 [Penicillium malachiteum]